MENFSGSENQELSATPKPDASLHSESGSVVYHDVYDFAILPISLGDVFTWVLKTALRCRKAGRERLHIHIVGDAKKSGSSILLPLANTSADLFIFELLPAFYSCPILDGLTFHGSREAFESQWSDLAASDPLAQAVWEEHQNLYQNRTNVKSVLDFLKDRCSVVWDINDDYAETGYLPRLRVMPECEADVAHMKAAYPDITFWVTVHSRLSRLDGGLRSGVPENYFNRDASFLQWYQFMEKTNRTMPNVRFVLVGRLQEKPLAMLKLPNVVAPRTLGMTVGHEIALIAHSHLFMGSLAGPAEMAIFSPADYAIFNCTAGGCKNFGVPYGATHLPFATPHQRLYYGKEDADLLGHVLEERVRASALKGSSAPSATHRFFISTQEEDRELHLILQTEIRDLTLQYELGQYAVVKKRVHEINETFPHVALQIPNYRLLKALLEVDHELEISSMPHESATARRNELMAQLIQTLYPQKLDFQMGAFSRTTPVSSGLRRDGWCNLNTTFRLGSSTEGDLLIFAWRGTTCRKPLGFVIQIKGEKPHHCLLKHGEIVLEIPITQDHLRTDVSLLFDSDGPISALDPHVCSASLLSVEIGTKSTLDRFYARSLEQKDGAFGGYLADCSGLRNDGWCGIETKLTLGNSSAGAHVSFIWVGTALKKPVGVLVQVDGEKPVRWTISPEGGETKFTLTQKHQPTHIFLTFDSGAPLSPEDPASYSAILQSVKIVGH